MFWVGQFGVVDGKAQEESPWVGLFPDTGRAHTEETVDLFVVVEPALPGSEDYCRDLSQAIGKQFRERRLSLTGGILRALKAAHENLRDWNRRSLKQHQVAAGASCLALRGGAAGTREAYLGQVGPAAAGLLLSTGLASTFSDEELAEALRPHPEDTLPVLYGRAKEMRHCAAILVAALA